MPNPSPTPRQHFNSRPSARGDPFSRLIASCVAHFNSRPSARGDLVAPRYLKLDFISIHAPPRGATSKSRRMPVFSRFQFTPLREGRPDSATFFCRKTYFNSRPSARGDSKRYAISANLLFNPYKSAWLNNNATQFVEIILVIFHRIIA